MGGSAVAAAADDLLANGGGVGRARFESDQVFAERRVRGGRRGRPRDRARCACAGSSPSTTPGRIMNPLLAEGQVIGGAVQGLGACLTEEVATTRRSAARSLLDYGLLTAAEIPEFATEFVESPSPLNPLGAKGIGESGAIGAPPAVANALADALRPPPRPAVHRREGLAGAPVILETPLDEAWAALSTLAAGARRRSPATPAPRLEEADDDTHTAMLRLQGTGPNGPVTATVTATLERVDDRTRLHLATRTPTRSPTPRRSASSTATLAAASTADARGAASRRLISARLR